MIYWKLAFWSTAIVLIFPVPFKVYGYLTGKDKSSKGVKVEESLNAIFLSFGLVPFWAYSYSQQAPVPLILCKVWFGVAIALSVFSVFKSKKLDYAKNVLGKKLAIYMSIVSTILFFPMFLGVYNYITR